METNTRNAVRIIVNESFEEKGNVMAHLTDAEKDNVLRNPEHADLERVTAALAEAKEAAVRDLADMPSELDMHPELTEEDDRPWNLDAEMDRLMKLDAEAFWENAHELPFDIGDSEDGDR